MTDSWDDYAAGWDDDETVTFYSRQAFEALCKTLDIAGLQVFDFGCGTGLLSEQMAEKASHIVALDPSAKMVAVLNQKRLQNVDGIVAEVTEELLESRPELVSAFNLVVASSVCSFVPDYQSTIKLLKRLLKPNGLFIQWDWLKSSEDPGSGFTQDEISSAFEQAGLKTISISTPFSLKEKSGEMKVVMAVGKNA